MPSVSLPRHAASGEILTAQQPLLAGVELGGTQCVCPLAQSADEAIDRVVVPTTVPGETIGADSLALRVFHSRAGDRQLRTGDLDHESPTWGFIMTTTKPGWRGTVVAARLRAPRRAHRL